MESGTKEPVDIIIEKLEKINENEKYCFIYRVYDHLRNLNKNAYEPVILAIGPYHHDTPNTKPMERHKLFYLKSLLRRKQEIVKTCFSDIKEIEQEARECYDRHIKFDSTEFINMMLIDGCFIIELLLKYADNVPVKETKDDPHIREEDDNSSETDIDDIFDMKWMMGNIKRDLMLFENQIPFFILEMLFDHIAPPNNSRSLINLLFKFFKDLIPDKVGFKEKNRENTNIMHLLNLIHYFWTPPLSKPQVANNEGRVNSITSAIKLEDANVKEKHDPEVSLFDVKFWTPSSSTSQVTNGESSVKFITSATKLEDANVKFENHDTEVSLFDVKFENGTLKMTPLIIADKTEALFRNLMVYEQYFPSKINFVTEYVKFLDCLIDSPKDVEILREHKILDNWLGTDTVVSDIFIKLTDSIFIPSTFSYVEVVDNANKHCKKRRNKWMAILRRNHLSSPWAIISMIAAAVLLLLTIVQTVFTIL